MRPRRSSLSRYLGEGESPVLITRQHPFALVSAAARTLGMLLPLAIATWGIAGVEVLRGPVADWVVRLAFLGMLAMIGALAWRVLSWEFERVVITGEKVIHLEGVLHRRIASTPLAKVSEFTVRQPLLGRVFDYGSLVVDVPGGRDQALHGLAFLPDPAGMYRMVSDLARSGRMQEGGGARVEAPSEDDIERIDAPWSGELIGDEADHTIDIARVGVQTQVYPQAHPELFRDEEVRPAPGRGAGR